MGLISKSLFAAALLAASAASAQNLNGAYKVDGRNPDGSSYSGTAILQQSASDVGITWTVANSSYAGRGTLTGAVLSVDWGQAHPVLYVLTTDGSLHGTWADGTALEKLTPFP